MAKAGTKVAREWTDAHRREAFARLFELTAERIRDMARGDALGTTSPACDPQRVAWSEAIFRESLSRGGHDDADIEREVRRVDGLATGRLERETVIRYVRRASGLLDEDFGTMGGARLAASQCRGGRAAKVHVTRIRRA